MLTLKKGCKTLLFPIPIKFLWYSCSAFSANYALSGCCRRSTWVDVGRGFVLFQRERGTAPSSANRNETFWLNMPKQAIAFTVTTSLSSSPIQAQLRDPGPVIVCFRFETLPFQGLPARPADSTAKHVNALHRLGKNERFIFHHNSCRDVHNSFKQVHFGFDKLISKALF